MRRSPSRTHTMVLVGPRQPGAEEWFCPACGRRLLMEWPPRYAKLVVEPGDEAVTHVGGKGGVAESDPAA